MLKSYSIAPTYKRETFSFVNMEGGPIQNPVLAKSPPTARKIVNTEAHTI